MHGAVAQRIERHTDYVAGSGFKSRQWHAHQVAPQFVARGYFFGRVGNVSDEPRRNICPVNPNYFNGEVEKWITI